MLYRYVQLCSTRRDPVQNDTPYHIGRWSSIFIWSGRTPTFSSRRETVQNKYRQFISLPNSVVLLTCRTMCWTNTTHHSYKSKFWIDIIQLLFIFFITHKYVNPLHWEKKGNILDYWTEDDTSEKKDSKNLYVVWISMTLLYKEGSSAKWIRPII